MGDATWRTPPDDLDRSSRTVHVWRADLSAAAGDHDRYRALLNGEEAARADRFHFEKDRRCFAVCRGILRLILARHLGGDAAGLGFRYGSWGKPALDQPRGVDLRFNVSHAGDLALYAVAFGRDVGVDVERIRTDMALDELADSFFAPGEATALRGFEPPMSPEGFFACWTRKEAYIKARGEGLSLGLDTFEVSVVPGEDAVLLRSALGPSELSRWRFRELTPGPGYAGALAVEGDGWELGLHGWPAG